MDIMDITGVHAPLSTDMVFEGPEKKLEVYFKPTQLANGLRQYPAPVWSELLVDAACTILSVKGNDEFDAYLLSESSLFVYPYRVVLKTCGTTTLLLVLPKLLRMVEEIGSSLELLQYGHLRYKFPEQQVFPHGSFAEERDYLIDLFGEVTECELGPRDCSWSMLSVSKEPNEAEEPSVYRTPPTSPPGGDDILEIAMEGLTLDVCALFCRATAPSAESVYGVGAATLAMPVERELATRMTVASGLRALLPGVEIDDWAFEPCGYSMNGLRNGYYYTVHITPEPAFSYASFETNDPSYRDTESVRRIVRAFAPSLAVVTLTTRRIGCELPAYELDGLERSALDLRRLGDHAFVCCATFLAKDDKNAHLKPEPLFAKSQCQATLEPRSEMVQVA